MPPEQGEITLLLNQWRDGNPSAFERLLPLVYPRLRELAGSYLRRERVPGVMQPTSLVNEFYLRLVARKQANWGDRAHFFTFSAKIMRMILIDNARGNQAQRRGGGTVHVPLDEDIAWIGIDSTEMVELNQALEALSLVDEEKVQLVELRYFLGCTAEETAALMQMSKSTVDRDLKFARVWLFRHTKGDSAKSPA